MATQVAVLVGSLRDKSFNHRLARALKRLAPEGWEFTDVRIDEVPYYDQDDEKPSPESVTRLKEAIEKADALMFVTAEYNRSIPGVLKNAIDWASRPYGENSFAGKPTLIAGTSPGNISTAVAQAHLRSILAYLDAPVMGQPEVYIAFQPTELIDMDGNVSEKDTEEFLRGVMTSFEEFVEMVKAGQASVT